MNEKIEDNTIVIFPYTSNNEFVSWEEIKQIVKKETKTRDWLPKEAYRCLPLTIGNKYGFTISLPYDIALEWNGGSNPEDVSIYYTEPKEIIETKKIKIVSHIGQGIVTIITPFLLKTPKNVNLMTINPPNYILPNLTVLTGVVETDNIKFSMPINIKIQMPNIRIHAPADSPLAGVLPIPRFYADQFELKWAKDLFDENVIQKENQANTDWINYNLATQKPDGANNNQQYLKGVDVYGNRFENHQIK